MAINPLLQWLVNTAKTSSTVIKKNTETKAKNALWWLVTTQKETMPKARAKALLPWLVKVAETTGKVWQANVAKKQEQAKELLSGMTATVNQWFAQAKDTALNDLQADVSAWMPKEELRNFYPDIPENVVEDLYTDLQAGMPIEEAKNFYPEIYELPKVWQKQEYIWPNSSIKWFAWQDDWWIIPNIPRFDSTVQDTTWGTNLDYIKWFWKNLLKSTWNLAIDIANAWLNVLEPNKTNTAYQLASVWAWAWANLLWLDKQLSESSSFWQEANQKADMLWGMFKERYGSMENISKTAYEDPTWVFSDALSVIWAWWSALKAGTMWSKVWVLGKVWNVADDLIKVWALDPANKIAQLELQAVKWVWKWIAKIPWAWVKAVWWILWKVKNSRIPNSIKTSIKRSPEKYQEYRKIWEASVNDIKNVDTLTNVANEIDDAVKIYVTKPKQEVWKKIWQIKQAIKERWNDLIVDNTPTVKEFDNIFKNKYGATGGTEKERALMGKIKKEIWEIKTFDDITNTFDKRNAEFKTLQKQWETFTNKQFSSDIWKLRETLEVQFDDLFWPEYKSLRKKYWELSLEEQRFSNLFSRKKPWMNEDYTSMAKIKKLFSPDKWSVLDDFKLLQEKTGIDFIDRANIAKFIGEEVWDPKVLSLLQGTKELIWWWKLWIVSNIIDWVWDKIVGQPLDIAQDIVNKSKKIPMSKKPETIKWIEKILQSIKDKKNINKADIEKQITAIMLKSEWPLISNPLRLTTTPKTRTLWPWATQQTKRPLSLPTKNVLSPNSNSVNTNWVSNKKINPLSFKKSVKSDTLVSKSDEMKTPYSNSFDAYKAIWDDARATKAFERAQLTTSDIKSKYKDGTLTKQDVQDIIYAKKQNSQSQYIYKQKEKKWWVLDTRNDTILSLENMIK